MHHITEPLLYLSGDIQKKLRVAKKCAEHDPSFENEISALTQAIPVEIPIEDVDIRIGATWIPLKFYEEFVLETFNEQTKFYYSPSCGTWDVKLLSKGASTSNESQYGFQYDNYTDTGTRFTETIRAVDNSPEAGLFTMALHFKAPSVSRRKAPGENNRKCQLETGRAVAKQEELQMIWAAWCKEGDRGLELAAIYNQQINRTVLTNWDGKGQHIREHLRATGMNEDWVVRLRPYQLDSIWRLCVGSNCLLGLEVGLGKTACAIAAAMLRKHYKTANKILIVVQKSTLKQFYETFKMLYPKAKILCTSPDSYNAQMRQRFLARASFWEWDAIIMTHEQFGKIPVKSSTEIQFVERQLSTIKRELLRLYADGESSERVGKKRGNRVVKKLEGIQNRIEERLLQLRDTHDTGIYFEDIAPDVLVIDEAQKYKNNLVVTRLQVTGLNITESNRASDFDLKLAFMRDRHGDKFLWLLTGTPEPTNSMTGLYVFQKYLQPEELEIRGMSHFDSWAMNFGRIVSEAEFKPDGSLRITDRFCEFVNLPELLQMWLDCCYIKRFDDVAGEAGFTRPSSKLKKVMCSLSQFQLEYMQQIKARYELVISRSPAKFPSRDRDGFLLDDDDKQIYHPVTQQPITDMFDAERYDLKVRLKVDNYLWLATDCRKLMLAPQLIDPDVPVGKKDKIAQAVRRIYRWWNLTKEKKSTQLVFLDWGTPGGSSKFFLYGWIKDELIKRGVPQTQIAFIQDYGDDDKKEELFAKVNAGEVRILIGSTDPMGIGVNVQKKVKCVHLIDIPRRPDQYEQRLGRAIRYGNENSEVLVYQYLTRGQHGNFGANAYDLQLLEKKLRTREQVLRGDPTVRRIVEDNSQLEIFMMLKAHSSGDERILELMNVSSELDKKENKCSLVQREVNRISVGNKDGSLSDMKKKLRAMQDELSKVVDDVKIVTNEFDLHGGSVFNLKIQDMIYTGNEAIAIKAAKKTADEHLRKVVSKFQDACVEKAKVESFVMQEQQVASIGSFPIMCKVFGKLGNMQTIMYLKGKKLTYAFKYHTSDQRLIRNLLESYKSIMAGQDIIQSKIDSQQKLLDSTQQLLEFKRREFKVLQSEIVEMKRRKLELQAVLEMSAEMV